MTTAGALVAESTFVLPAAVQPSTPAQFRRYERIIDVASALLLNGGDEALQMRDVADRAGVALATLYRYFPSKQRLVLAIGIHRMREQQAAPPSASGLGGTVVERAAAFLLRHLRRELSSPLYTACLRAASVTPEPEHRALVDQLDALFMQNFVVAVGPFSNAQLRTLGAIVNVADAAAALCITGLLSAREARFQILVAVQLLDLSAEVVDAASESAVIDGSP